MAGMEMVGNWNWANLLKFIALYFRKLSKTQVMVDSLFKNSLDIILLMFYEHFGYEKGTVF